MEKESNILRELENFSAIDHRNITRVLNRENLKPLQIFSTGNSGCIVLKAVRDLDEFVLKIPTDDHSLVEILNNIRGFDNLRREGLDEMLPEFIGVGKVDKLTYILSTYLGNDFAADSRKAGDGNNLFSILSERIFSIYKKTLKNDSQPDSFINNFKIRLNKNFKQYIIPAGIVKTRSFDKFIGFDANKYSSKFNCFGGFDFTPEDIYLKDNTVKYPDPKSEIRGNPIIALACFAGVSRDIYCLPGAIEGYELLHRLATTKVADLLELADNQAESIFNLGRALQFSLSSRFRIEKDPGLAEVYAMKGLEYLELATQL